MFVKYQHVERFGNDEVLSIELGLCHVFPKIDGTNASVWIENGEIKAGSRNREITPPNKDNAGFYEHISKDDRIINYLNEHPTHRLYGEWLVPHSLKTYREDCWRKFYVFDVCVCVDADTVEYLPYDTYKPLLEAHNIDYIPCMTKIKSGSYEQFINSLNQNNFLIRDGEGAGEGIVIKNYDFYNKYGRQTWAKIVTSEFKEKHAKEMGAPEVNGRKMIEEEIVNKYVTVALIDKTYDKIRTEKDGWTSKYIPELLNRVYYDLVNEECWNFVKEMKRPTVNFGTLAHLTTNKIKETKIELF
jgi:hypothetical protein